MNQHRLSTFSELAQIISAVAIVISLFYVGIQVRQNTLVTKAAMRQSIADNDITFLMTYLDNTTIAEATSKLKLGEQLTTIEWEQLVAQQQVNFRVFENAHYQYVNGLLEHEVWDRYRIIIGRLLQNNQAAIEQWNRNDLTYTSPFQNEVREILNDTSLKDLISKRNEKDSLN